MWYILKQKKTKKKQKKKQQHQKKQKISKSYTLKNNCNEIEWTTNSTQQT